MPSSLCILQTELIPVKGAYYASGFRCSLAPPAGASHDRRANARGCMKVTGNQSLDASRHRDLVSRLPTFKELDMDQDAFNQSIRKFLKHFGVTAQREIEQAVQRGIADGTLKGNEALPVRATLVVGGVVRDFAIDGEITLG